MSDVKNELSKMLGSAINSLRETGQFIVPFGSKDSACSESKILEAAIANKACEQQNSNAVQTVNSFFNTDDPKHIIDLYYGDLIISIYGKHYAVDVKLGCGYNLGSVTLNSAENFGSRYDSLISGYYYFIGSELNNKYAVLEHSELVNAIKSNPRGVFHTKNPKGCKSTLGPAFTNHDIYDYVGNAFYKYNNLIQG